MAKLLVEGGDNTISEVKFRATMHKTSPTSKEKRNQCGLRDDQMENVGGSYRKDDDACRLALTGGVLEYRSYRARTLCGKTGIGLIDRDYKSVLRG
jgi:hypothetical protein